MFRDFALSACILILSFGVSLGQKPIKLENPSFEDTPHAGVPTMTIKSWSDCGATYFDHVSPPNIHLGKDYTYFDEEIIFFGVQAPSSDGYTFLGLVTRDNGTYESVGQSLKSQLKKDSCYRFNIDLCTSDSYYSPFPISDMSEKYTNPVVLRIYGGSSLCEKLELLEESYSIDNTEWETYEFEFSPSMDYKFIILEAYYQPDESPYNGNLLLDNASKIRPINCSN